MATRILVWDIPTRVFHWLLAGSFAGAFLTAESETWRDLHVLLGYTVVGLIGSTILVISYLVGDWANWTAQDALTIGIWVALGAMFAEGLVIHQSGDDRHV